MRSFSRIAGACVLICGLSIGFLYGEDPVFEDRLFYVSFDSQGINPWAGRRQCQFFQANVWRGRPDASTKNVGRGTPLSGEAVEVAESQKYIEHRTDEKLFPTGATDQAVAFDARDNINPDGGCVIFWVKGIDWNLDSPDKEIFFTIEAADGKAQFLKSAPGMLSLISDGKGIDIGVDFKPNLFHQIAINYEKGKAVIFIDGKEAGEGHAAFPGNPENIIIGQKGPGPGTNKYLDDFSIYNRPLKVSEINRLYHIEGDFEMPRATALIKTKAKIKIDGIIEKDEWADASELTGMMSTKAGNAQLYDFYGYADAADVAQYIFVTYDDEYLYVAYDNPPPAKIADNAALVVAMLKNTITQHDANVDDDDSFRITVIRPYPNGDDYKMWVNGINTTYDFTHSQNAPGSQLKGINLSWEPGWITASNLDINGWHLEAAIPWTGFEFEKPKPGDFLHINFVREWKQVLSEDDAWAYGKRTADEKNEFITLTAGKVVFQGDEGVIVKLKEVGKIKQGKFNFVADIVNRAARAAEVKIEVASNSGEISKAETVTIGAGKTYSFNYGGRISDFHTRDIAFKVSDAGTGAVYHLTTMPVLRKDRPDIYLRKYPTAGLIKFEVNYEFLSQFEPKDISFELFIRNKDASGYVFKKNYKKLKGYTMEIELSTKEWPEGAYLAEFNFKARGKKSDTATVSYEKNPTPEWYDNKIGYLNYVPYPWTPMKLNENAEQIGVWGRTYAFAGSLFPKRITTVGRQLLRSPMRLVIETDEGSAATDAMKADVRWSNKTPLIIEGTRTVKHGKLTIENSFRAEYDGLIWSTVTLKPEGKVTLKNLKLEIPFTREFTDVIQPFAYSQKDNGELKPEGYTGPLTYLWLGNGDGGLQWAARTDAFFFLKDRKKLLRVTNDDGVATMIINMCDVETVLDGPHSMDFGFVATPVKKKIRRTAEDPEYHRMQWGYGWFPPGQLFLPGAEKWGPYNRFNRSYNLPGHMMFGGPYVSDAATPTYTDAFRQFGDEWLKNPNDRPTDTAAVTQEAKSYRDWFVWRYNEEMKRAPLVGYYYDVSGGVDSINTLAGAGYRKPDGTVVATNSMLGCRDITKRLYNIAIHYYPWAGIGYHDSGGPNMVYMSFATFFWDGENYNSVISAKRRNYRGVLTPARFRAEYMGHNFGCHAEFLGQGRIKSQWADEIGGGHLVIDHITGLSLLHDTEPVNYNFIRGDLSDASGKRHEMAMDKHKLRNPSYRFVPYWHQKFVKLDSKDLYASFYVHKPFDIPRHYYWRYYDRFDRTEQKKVIAIFCNESDWKGVMKLDVDWKALGFDDWKKLKVENAVHSIGFRIENKDKDVKEQKPVFFDNSKEEYAKIEEGKLIFPMSEWNYRMIVISEE